MPLVSTHAHHSLGANPKILLNSKHMPQQSAPGTLRFRGRFVEWSWRESNPSSVLGGYGRSFTGLVAIPATGPHYPSGGQVLAVLALSIATPTGHPLGLVGLHSGIWKQPAQPIRWLGLGDRRNLASEGNNVVRVCFFEPLICES